jgi:hypothetical protein
MVFYLLVRLAVSAPAAGDLLTEKTMWGSFATLAWPGSTRRDNPPHFWITVAWRTLAAATVAVLAIGLRLPDIPCMVSKKSC